MSNPRATETILRQFVDSGSIPFEERTAMEDQGLIVLNGSRFELTPAGKAVLYGFADVDGTLAKAPWMPAEKVQRVLNQQVRSLIDPSLPMDVNPGAQDADLLASISRFGEATGWRPETSLDEGLRQTVDWHKRRQRLDPGALAQGGRL